MIFILTVVAYLLIGALSGAVWSKGFWERNKTKEWIERSGYSVVAHEAKAMRTLFLGMWPVFLPWMILNRISNALDVATDPHIEHRKQFKESMRNYIRLRQLELEVNGSSEAGRPEAWCVCLEDLNKD